MGAPWRFVASLPQVSWNRRGLLFVFCASFVGGQGIPEVGRSTLIMLGAWFVFSCFVFSLRADALDFDSLEPDLCTT